MEVRHLLSQAILETPSCSSKHSSPRRPISVAVPTTPLQKLEGPSHPHQHLPNCCHFQDWKCHLPVDAMELWENANKALEDLLTTKASIDAWRQRAVWEQNVVLCQKESQAAKSIKEAKAACSQATLDTCTTCSQLVLKAKTACSMAVREDKTTRGCLIHEAKATCFKAIIKVKAQRIFQAALFQR